MNCPNCGKKFEENQKFCSDCGTSLTEENNNLTNLLNKNKTLIYSIIGSACVIAIIFAGISYTVKLNTNEQQTTETAEEVIDEDMVFDPEIARKTIGAEFNCLYTSSNYTCFTTQAFKAEPIKEGKDFKDNNYWLGAKDACESKGYRLPNDEELRSLFSDIMGINIDSGMEVKTVKYADSKIPDNYDLLRQIAPKGFDDSDGARKWDNVIFWENEMFDDVHAYARKKYRSWYEYTETEQYAEYIKLDYNIHTICVYDPNGKPHKSLLEITKEKQKIAKQQAEQKRKEEEEKRKEEEKKKQEQMDNEAEDVLF